MWPNWDPKAVPAKWVPILEEILEGLVDGTFAVQQIDTDQNFGQPDEIILGLWDMRRQKYPAPGYAGPTGTTGTSTTPPAAPSVVAPSHFIGSTGPPMPGLTDLGVITEPVIGFRDFVLRTSIDGPILMSRNDHPWVYRKRMRALCASTNSGQPFSKHDAPEENCQCGIYGYARPNDPNLQQRDVVWGEIAMWGEVLICEKGYRSQFAYPLNLFIRDNGTRNVHYLAEELQELYGVPCFVVSEREGKTAAEVMSEMIEGMLRPIKEDE